MKLRNYQQYAVDELFSYFNHNKGNPLVVMPTGTGKSLVIAGFIKRIFELYCGQRVLLLTHVQELISQNYDKLLKVWQDAPCGIYSAGLNKKELNLPIIFGGVKSVCNVVDKLQKIDLVIVDECHLIGNNANSQYLKLLTKLKENNPHLKVIGLTATHYRMGMGLLTEGPIFTDVCVDLTQRDYFNWFFDEGYLSLIIPKATKQQLDLTGVKIQAGDYVQTQLQNAVNKDEITEKAVLESIEKAHDRKSWLVFASGIEHAESITDMLNYYGVSAKCVHSKIKNRSEIIKEHEKGEFTALINKDILTTGYDNPYIDFIMNVRPTKSTGLWVQILGRGTRPVYVDGFDLETTKGRLTAIKNGPKQNCLILDFADNTSTIGPINDPRLPKKKGKKGGETPVKICPLCETYNHPTAKFCIEPDCDYEFVFLLNINTNASEKSLIAGKEELEVTEFTVDKVVYHKYSKHDKPNSIKVDYYCGIRRFSEWVCLEHKGFAGKKARDWWRQRVEGKTPETVDQALLKINDIKSPSVIKVWVNKKYPEILGYKFN